MLAAAGIFLLMHLWSGGWFWFYLVRVPAGVGIEWGQVEHALTFFLVTALAATGAFAFPLARHLKPSEAVSVWAAAFVLGTPLCLLQSGKWGATMNAFLPLLPLMGILCALLLNHLMKRAKETAWLPVAALSLAAAQIGLLHYRPLLPTAVHAESHTRIVQWVRAAQGEVLVSGFSSHAYMNGKRFWGDPTIMCDLEKAGLWRGNEAIDKVRRGEFAMLLLRPAVEPRDLARAVRRAYVPMETIAMTTDIGGWPYMTVYVPRTSPWRLED